VRSVASMRSYSAPLVAPPLLAALVLTGCSSSSEPQAAASPTQATSAPTSTSGSPAPTDTSGSPSPASPSGSATSTPTRSPGAGVTPGGGGTAGTAQIGSTPITYPSGIAVSVTSATQYIPSSLAVGTATGHTGVVVSVTVDNGSTQPLDTSYLTVAMRTGSELTMAAQIFDAANGYDSGITGTIAPGDTATGQYAFDVPASDLSSLNLLVTPDLRSPSSAMFTGSAAPATAAPTS
jgi:hypothetical protein